MKANSRKKSVHKKPEDKVHVAIVGFPYHHPTCRRIMKMIEALSEFDDIMIDLVTVTHWLGAKDARIMEFERENLKMHFLKPIFLSRASHQFRFFMWGLFRKLKEIDPDFIFIVNEPLALNTFFAALYAKWLRKKIVGYTWDNLYLKKILPIRLYENATLKRLDMMIAGTQDAKDVLVKKGFLPENIMILQQAGIDTRLFKPGKDNRFNISEADKERTILFCGQLVTEKGVGVILKAKQELEKRGREYLYVFVGRGEWEGRLRKLAKTDKHIRVFPWISDYEKLPSVYNCASLFVYPQIPTSVWEEQFGYAIIEAMACGLPVISSNMSGPRTTITDNHDGFLIKSGDYAGLSDKIELLMENHDLRKKFSRRAIQKAKQYDSKKNAEEFHKLFIEIRRKFINLP